MEAGGSQGRVNLTTFSLTELSLLMRILDEIHLPEIYFSSESSFENVFRQKGGQVIARIGLAVDDRMVIDFRLKIRAVIRETDSREITVEEFARFAPFLIQGPNNTYNLYNLFYSNYVRNNDNNVKGRLEQFYINPQLHTRISEQLENNTLGYHRELREMQAFREMAIRKLYIPYTQPVPTVDEQEAAELLTAISQQASGRRRRRNGNGGNGNGGNGQHGGGRGRHD
uniref:Uncharacterized protein n=1 Tax=Meloidogyne javanica TaxID=6303 RepID=A0A915N6F4_MELJA